jgi:hypothetical protein
MAEHELTASVLRELVTPQRVATVISAVAGEVVEVGPIDVGPGGVATATAVGQVGEPDVTMTSEQPLAYLVRLPVDLTLEVLVSGGRHHYTAECEVRIGLTVHAIEPLSARIDPTPPTAHDVSAKVKARGMQAKLVGKVGDIDNEVKRQVARYVCERIEADAAAHTTIDLRPLRNEDLPD